MKNLNLFQINTSAWEEEDFLLFTDLNEKQITSVISPIIQKDRREEELTGNETLVEAIKEKFPNAIIQHYDPSNIDLISI